MQKNRKTYASLFDGKKEKSGCVVVVLIKIRLLLITILFVFAVDVLFVLDYYAYTHTGVVKHILFN